jgi:hypothetical protein
MAPVTLLGPVSSNFFFFFLQKLEEIRKKRLLFYFGRGTLVFIHDMSNNSRYKDRRTKQLRKRRAVEVWRDRCFSQRIKTGGGTISYGIFYFLIL